MKRFLFGFFFVAIAALWYPPAALSIPYPCNPNALGPGERHIGFAPGGQGVAPTPLCVQDEMPETESAAKARPDPSAQLGALNDSISVLLRQTIDESGLTLTPEERAEREAKGYWSFSHLAGILYLPGIMPFEPEESDVCWATFNIRKEQGEMTFGVIGPEPRTNHAYLMFIASTIPQPSGPLGDLVWVEFQQNEDPPVRRRVQLVAMPQRPDSSLMAIGVPKLRDVIDNLDEGYRFRLHMDGAEIFDVTIHGVDKVNERLTECEAFLMGARAVRNQSGRRGR